MENLLQRPEYIHVVLNHLPVVGLAIAVLALAIALFARNWGAVFGALLLVAVMAASIWPVIETGQSAYNRIRAVSDPPGATLLKQHMTLAERWAWLYYLTAAAAAIGAVLVWKRPSLQKIAALTVIALSLASLIAGIAIAHLGAKVRHPEFRPGTNLVPDSPDHHH